jgi:hypothetical protein
LTSLKKKLMKISAKAVSHRHYVKFQMAEVAVPWVLFAEILSLIGRLRAPPGVGMRKPGQGSERPTGELRPEESAGARGAFALSSTLNHCQSARNSRYRRPFGRGVRGIQVTFGGAARRLVGGLQPMISRSDARLQ